MHKPDALPRAETITFVKSCQHESGGFGAHPGHDAHLLYTLSAIQTLALVDALDEIEHEGVVNYISNLQDKSTGVFSGDEWGEQDTRFVYTALSALKLLNQLDAVDVEMAVKYIMSCRNYD